jgi:elongation factor 2
MTNADQDKELGKKCPLANVLLDMIVTHLPNPNQAQKYRVQRIWTGDPASQVGQDMANCNAKGKLSAIVTKVVPDPHAGVVCTSRLFSGSLRAGEEVYLVGQRKRQRVQQVSVYRGPRRLNVDEALAGNIIGIVGLGEAFSGETICSVDDPIAPFESIKHIFEPVVTKSIEPKDVRDLPKLIDYLKQVNREDPSIEIKINEETGEYLVSGLGELHIDAKIERPLRERGIDIKSSTPIVVYRETIEAKTPSPVEGKSPNKHNKFYMIVEPLEEGVFELLSSGVIPDDRLKKLKQEDIELFVKAGMDREEIKKYLDIYNKNILINATKGIQYLNETFEHMKNAFRDVCNEGPLAREPCLKVKVMLMDADLHEDAIHRGPAQVIPAVRQAIKEAMLQSKPRILEPLQDIRIDAPEETTGPAMNEIQNRRGQVEDVSTELGASMIRTKIPVAEMFGFEGALKSATQGKGFYSLINVYFEKLPMSLQEGVVAKIRARKGLTPEQA